MTVWSPKARKYALAATGLFLLAGRPSVPDLPAQEPPSETASPETVEAQEEAAMRTPYEKEIHELHDFFQAWFRGELPDTDEAFARFEGVMADSMVHINPGGTASEREVLVPAIRNGYGSWKGRGEKWQIKIEDVRLRHDRGDTLVVTYEEWQLLGEQIRGRLSTVVFARQERTPNGLEWLHVHEVWMPRREE